MAKKRVLTPDEAFLQSICESPHDDGPRLVYADWLEENGQAERAEFIRLQFRLADMDEDDPDRAALQEREWELLTVHGDAWRGKMPAWARKSKYEFRRGFVSWINLTATQFLRSANNLSQTTPIAAVQVRSMGHQQFPEVAASPSLVRLRSLDLRDNKLIAADIRTLTASPHLTGLTELGLAGNQIGAEGLHALATWEQLAQITSLDLAHNGLHASTIKALVGSRHLRCLARLDLGLNTFGDPVHVLASAPRLMTLRHLGLAHVGTSVEAMRALGASEHLPNLTSLDIDGLGPDSCRELAMSALCSRLTSIRLRAIAQGKEIATAFSSSPYLVGLRRLDLSHTHLEDEGAQSLATIPFQALTALRLAYNRIQAPGAEALASSPRLASLNHLSLAYNPIGPEGARALVSSPFLTNLTSLDLTGCGIGAEGVRALATSSHLSKVRVLELDGNNLTNQAAAALAASPCLRQLHHLGLRGNWSITDKAVQALLSSPHLASLIAVSRGWRSTSTVVAPRLVSGATRPTPT